jgi:hypothetical protein
MTPADPAATAGPGQNRETCPRCGRRAARMIGRSPSQAALYLRCDDCGNTSVAPA